MTAMNPSICRIVIGHFYHSLVKTEVAVRAAHVHGEVKEHYGSCFTSLNLN